MKSLLLPKIDRLHIFITTTTIQMYYTQQCIHIVSVVRHFVSIHLKYELNMFLYYVKLNVQKKTDSVGHEMTEIYHSSNVWFG